MATKGGENWPYQHWAFDGQNIWWPAKVCTVETSKTSHHRLYSQNPKSKYSWCSLLKAKIENTSFMLFFCSKSRCWLLLELVLGIFLASIPALVSSSLFCHVNNAKTDKTSFDIPKMCPTGFKTFNGSKSFDVKWYTFLNIFQYMYMSSNSLVHSYCDNWRKNRDGWGDFWLCS